MRILHIVDHVPPAASGHPYDRRILALLRQQKALGWQTWQLAGVGQPAHEAIGHDGGRLPWRFYGTPAAAGAFEQLPLLGAARLLTRRLQQVVVLTRPDLLHAHSPVINAIAALRVGRRCGLPVLFEAHAPPAWSAPAASWGGAERRALTRTALLGAAARFLELCCARRAGAVVTNSEAMRQRLCGAGVAPTRLTLVPDGLDPARYPWRGGAEREAGDGALLVGHAADGPATIADAGVELLLAALAILLRAGRELRLLLACAPARADSLRAAADRRGLGAHLELLAREGAAQAGLADAALQRRADIVVFVQVPRQPLAAPPRRLLEALARGCVVAAADCPAHRELVEHGRNGMLFAAGDGAALADALAVLLDGRSRWPALRAAARWRIDYQRSWEVCVARYGPVYQALLAARRRRPA